MSSASTPPAVPGDSVPGASVSHPGVALWSDSDSGRPAGASFAGLVAAPGDRAMPTIGHIGRYALKYQLGSGGLGTVFAAHDPLLSRLIAVKTLNLEISDEEREAFNALFINEARAAGGLSHPHIVTVFDAGISDKRAYIAMELLKGRDLRQLRQEGWRATPAQAALIVRRVADALAFAHSKGVIHRDIKPANIFMVGRTQPRVLDFGIARIAHQRESGDALPGAGSPYYMAPEQVRREPADRRADVFSLGVVLYELLTDTKPFVGDSLKQITDAVLCHEPPLANKVDKGVPKALADIAARAMAKDPEQRFRSARSFARELRQWLDANPAPAEGDVAVPTAAPPATPHRRVPAIAVLGTVAAALVLASASWWLRGSVPDRAVNVVVATSPARVGVGAPPVRAVAPVALPIVVASPASTAVVAAAPVPPATVPVATTAVAASSPAISMQDSLLLSTIVPTAPTMVMRSAAPTVDATPAIVTPPAAPTVRRNETATVARTAATAPPPRESTKERRARESREREARVASAAPAAVATGTVKIAVSPWGQVEIDGVPSGAAPPLTEINLAEGRHQIVVRNGEFAPFVASIDVVAGQAVSLRHKFGS